MVDPISTPPWRETSRGRAWTVDIEELRRYLCDPPGWSTIGGWVIEAPWAHPIWHSYQIFLVHLRPIEGVETVLYREDATHEFWLHALDPDKPRQPVIEGRARAAWLTPCNFASQLVYPNDNTAKAAMEGAIELIVTGELSPDTDFQRQWEALFGNCMIKRGWRAT